MSYISNLNVRSNYSFLTSTISIKKYIKFAKENNLTSLVLSEKNVMYGTYEFYLSCKENGIKPVIGLNFQWLFQENKIELGIYAKNYQGYQTLINISSQVSTSEEPFLRSEVINKLLMNNKNIILVVAVNNLDNKVIESIFSYLKEFNISIFLGVNKNNINKLQLYKEVWKKIIPFFLINCLNKEDYKIYQVLHAIKKQEVISENELKNDVTTSFLNEQELISIFDSELVNNINLVINECNLEFNELSNEQKLNNLPNFPCPNNESSNKYLKYLCKKGLEAKFNSKEVPENYVKRLIYELKVINLMGFNDYFLIVNDYVNFAKKNKIMVGPGRGSVAGSLVAYVLGISDVDPIKFDLIFERFLNPERVSLPDIDIDFQDERREEIIQYLGQKYGFEHVAHIVTFQTIASKMAIRDLGRIFNISLEEVNEMTKLIPVQYNFDLQVAVDNSLKLKNYEQKYPLLFTLAKKIIGFPRQTSTHAAGIVFCKKKLNTIIPVQKGFNNILQTQYAMNYLESNGLIKMDILGLRNLTILQNILAKIKQYYNLEINLLSIPLNDQKTFNILKNGDTTGIFQLESPGMRNILKAMKTNDLEDIIASSSLFRPGPQEYIKTYINRKLKNEKVTFLHKDLEPYLKSTYGIIVYQEQVLLILQKIAGYSLAQADLIRRAIGKKDLNKMIQQENDFIKSASNKGYSIEIINKIWNDIKQFAGYGFNRSHAVAYSLIGYWLAYLKANFPLAFMSSLLTSVIGNDQKLLQYIYECQKYGINILPPSINNSNVEFSIDIKNNAILYALNAIKQMSGNTCYNLILERENNGSFQEFFEFIARANLIGLNKRNLEYLIYSGALDEINENRNLLLNNLNTALNYAGIVQIKDKKTNKSYLNLSLNKPTLELVELNFEENSDNEQKALGFYLKYNPENYWKKHFDTNNESVPLDSIENYLNQNVIVIAKITYIKTIKTKNNKLMAFVTIKSNNYFAELTVFENIYQQFQDKIQLNKIALLKARVTSYEQKVKLVLNEILNTN